MHGFPFWTIETTRRHGIRRRPVGLLAPQTYPEAVGQWLVDYRDRSGDMGFGEVRVLEHLMPGIAPVEIDPHTMIQRLHETARKVAAESAELHRRRYFG